MDSDTMVENPLQQARTRAYAMPLDEISPANHEHFAADVHWPYFERLRRESPVHFAISETVGPYWSITKYADILAIDADYETFSSTIANPKPNPPDDLALSMIYSMFIRKDPPKHDVQRKAVQPVLRPQNLANLETSMRARTAQILDEVPIDEVFDWRATVATDLTAMMLATLFDFPWEDRHKLLHWANVVADFGAGQPTARDASGRLVETEAQRRHELKACTDYFLATREARRAAPAASDAISILAHDAVARDLEPADYLGCVMMMLVGAKESTTDTISASLLAMAQHPEQYDKLRRDPALVPNLISETLRWLSPVAFQLRRATRDVEIRGKTIKTGDAVWLWYVSGNRDEEVMEEPDRFNIERERPRQHLAFGFGIHRCAGNRLVDLQLKIIWEEILKRFAKITLAGPPTLVESCFVRGYRSLPVRLQARL